MRCRAFHFDLGVTNVKETTRTCGSARAHNPFDGSVGERMKRMGLLTKTGSIEMLTLTALAHAFAGLLFDDLCDASQDYSGVQTELQQLFDAVDRAEPRQKFLLLCLQYDRLFWTSASFPTSHRKRRWYLKTPLSAFITRTATASATPRCRRAACGQSCGGWTA